MWTPDFFTRIREMIKTLEHRLAWMIAIIADTLQIVAAPFFAEGGISPLDTGLDVIVAVALTRLLGWHWAFLPTFAAELIPGLDLIPTWTAAVFFVTRQKTAAVEQKAPGAPRTHPGEPEILPPSPGRRA